MSQRFIIFLTYTSELHLFLHGKITTQTCYKLQTQAMQKKQRNIMMMQTRKKIRENIAVVQIV